MISNLQKRIFRTKYVRVLRQQANFLYLKYVKGFEVSEQPHLDPVAAKSFDALLKQTHLYLEFGSGGSTIAAARHAVRSISIESDARFAKAVQRKLGSATTSTMLVAPIGLTGEWGNPIFKSPTLRRLRRWRRYIDLPFEILAQEPGLFPDLILIDGRFRRACALESARKARLAGKATTIFFDDYIDRDYYHEIEDYLGSPRLSGRAAIFEINSGPTIPEAAVTEAIADFR